MSTRANIVIRDESSTIYMYRHSDGYPDITGKSLKKFVEGYATKLRNNASQSAGHLIIQGCKEYADTPIR